jgi:hypothetical protein
MVCYDAMGLQLAFPLPHRRCSATVRHLQSDNVRHCAMLWKIDQSFVLLHVLCPCQMWRQGSQSALRWPSDCLAHASLALPSEYGCLQKVCEPSLVTMGICLSKHRLAARLKSCWSTSCLSCRRQRWGSNVAKLDCQLPQSLQTCTHANLHQSRPLEDLEATSAGIKQLYQLIDN